MNERNKGLSGERREANDVQNVEIVKDSNNSDLADVLKLEKECLPPEWQYPEAEEYYEKVLKNPHDISIFLIEDGERVGYILGVPLGDAMSDLEEYDAELKNVPECYYLETIQILPESRGKGGAKKLILAMCSEANKKGITKFSSHARISNQFNQMIKRLFEKSIVNVRQIEHWKFGGNEPYEYIEWEFDSVNEKNEGKHIYFS